MIEVTYAAFGVLALLAFLMAIDPEFDITQSPWE